MASSRARAEFKPASAFVPKDQSPPSETFRSPSKSSASSWRRPSAPPTPSCLALRSAVGVLYHLDDFEVVRIGAGFFSDVFLVTPKSSLDKPMVLKMNKRRGDNMLRELQLLHKLRHPNILKFEGACVHQGQLHALTEYMDGGSLDALLASCELEWTTRMSFGRDIACGLDYLHSKAFFHRDLTSKNVFVKGLDWSVPVAVIGDFGLASRIPGSDERLPQVGSPYWMSPECLQGRYYDQASDIFSFGIIMCELISRLDADPDHLPRTANFGVDYIAFSALCPQCPPNFLKVAFNCVRIDPRGRPSASSLVSQLSRLLQSQRLLETPRHGVTKHLSNTVPNSGLRKRALSDEALKSTEWLCSPSEKARRHLLVKTSTMCVGREMSLRDPDYTPLVRGDVTNPFEVLPYFKQRLQQQQAREEENLFTSCFEDVDEAKTNAQCKQRQSVWPEQLRAAHSLPHAKAILEQENEANPIHLRYIHQSTSDEVKEEFHKKDSCISEESVEDESSKVDADVFEGRVQLLRRLYSGLASQQSSSTTRSSARTAPLLVTRDDAALSSLGSAHPLRRRGSCESGFYSTCFDSSGLSSTVSVGSSLMTLSDLEEDLRAASAFLCHDEEAASSAILKPGERGDHSYEKDIRAIVAYFETTCNMEDNSSLSRRSSVVGSKGERAMMPRLPRSHKIETLIKRVVEKESRDRLRRPQLTPHGHHQSGFGRQLNVCDGIVRSKLQFFDDKPDTLGSEDLVRRKKVGFVAAKTALFDQIAYAEERLSK